MARPDSGKQDAAGESDRDDCDDRACSFTIGHRDRDRLQVSVTRRSHETATDYWDGNWLRTPLSASLGRFTTEIPDAQLHAGDIRTFRAELAQLYDRLTGEAHLTSIDGRVDLRITGGGSGRLNVVGVICDEPGVGNRLKFTINGYDQTFLPRLLDELETVQERYPLRG